MMRRFITFAIEKPILNHLFLLFIMLVSIFSYTNISKEIFPPINMDKIRIIGGYAGTSADTLDKMAVKTIEDDLKNISQLQTIETTIKNGSFIITADIKPNSSNIEVLSDVKDVISETKRDLPSDMSEPVAKIVLNTVPLALIAIAGDNDTEELLSVANEFKSTLGKYKDLSDINIRGDSDVELSIKLDTKKIEAYGLTINEVTSNIKTISSIFPIGTIKENGNHLFISTFNGEKDIARLKDIRLNFGIKTVLLKDIANINFQLSDANELSHYNGARNVSINITKGDSGNAITLVKQIKNELKQLEEKYPNLKLEVYTDTSIWIKNRLNTVVSNILFGLILVFVAMLIFVNRGIALVVAMGIPLSFMIGIIATQYMGYSLNMLSLLGALIALGMLVDEAIVVAENIYRHLENGMERKEAVIQGTLEMFPAVISATLTTIFAFLPLLIMSGEMGAFIKILPIMITILLLSSLFEAFYFLPLHSKDFLKLRSETHSTHIIWAKIYESYDKTLHLFFKKPKLSLIIMVGGILIATFILMKNSKFQLFPDFDVTQIYVNGQVNINNDLEDTEKFVNLIEKKLLSKIDKEEVKSITSVIGMKLDAKNQPTLGDQYFQIFLDLHERAPDNIYNKYINPYLSLEYDASVLKRNRDAVEIATDVKQWIEEFRAKKLPNGKLMFEDLNTNKTGTGIVAHDIEIAISGNDNKLMLNGLKQLHEALANISGVHSISDDATIGEDELKLRVNSYGEELGFNEAIISSQLSAMYLKGEYSKMFNKDGLVRIKLESKTKDSRKSLESLQLNVPFTNQYVALKDICNFIYKKSFVTIKKYDGQRFRTVVASINNKIVTADEAMSKLEPSIKKLQNKGLIVQIKGEAKQNQQTKKEMREAAIMAIFLIFLTLVWLFDSLVKPLIVISTIPLVLLGVYVGHMLMGLNMSMPGTIGIIGLAGVVINDGLIMVEFIKKTTTQEELMYMAKTRLRPILLTSITTVIGLSTLIFFASGQATVLQPMAVSLGFGLAWATFLNLFYVPLLYAIIYKTKK